jgi:hypothetical protein
VPVDGQHGDVQAGRVGDHRHRVGGRQSARAQVARSIDPADVRHGQVDDGTRDGAEAESVRSEPEAEGEQRIVERGLVGKAAELVLGGARVGGDLAQPVHRA